jgi:hypothetical protein
VEKSAPKQKSPTQASKSSSDPAKKPPRLRTPHFIGIGLAVVVVVVLVLLLTGGGDSSSPGDEQATQGAKPVQVVSESGLLGAIKGVGYPIYWAGPRIGVEYEVSRPEPGRTFVRYLPKGEKAESQKAFLTVGSYKDSDALAGIQELGQKQGAILVRIAGGGTAYASGPDATSAYLAFPGIDTQVEVYDPQGGQALQLIRSGAVVPVS